MPTYAVIIAVLALIVIAGFAGIWIIAVRGQTPTRKPIDRKPAMPYEEAQWPSGNPAGTIKGWFIPAPASTSEPAPAIIIAHGWSSNRASMLRYATRLHAAGYVLLLYDARSHGESSQVKAASGATMQEDVRAAIDYISTRPEVDARRIGVLGHSLGAFGSMLAAGAGEHRIKALVTDAMPARMRTMVAAVLIKQKLPLFPLVQLIPWIWQLRTGIPRTQYDPVLAIDRTTIPILMIHSRGDDYIPHTELDYIRQHIIRNVKHLYLDSIGHSSSWQEEAFWEAVIPFFNKALSNRSKSIEFQI